MLISKEKLESDFQAHLKEILHKGNEIGWGICVEIPELYYEYIDDENVE